MMSNRAEISSNIFKNFKFWQKFSKFLFLGVCMMVVLAGVSAFNQNVGSAQALDCTPGVAVNTCHTLTGTGHTYCVFDPNGNTESSCKVESCFNGQNPPDCGGPAGQPATNQTFACMNNLALCGENTQFCENTTGGGSATIFKHGGVCDPSKGGADPKTGCIFLFDNVRSFTGPNCQDISTPQQPAPAPQQPAPATVTVCTGAVLTFDQLDAALRGANFPGPFNHLQSEIDAFNRAACPAANPAPPAPPAPAPPAAPTIQGVCPAGSTTPTLTWNSVAGAVGFDVRVDPQTADSIASFPRHDCGPHAVCVNNWPNTSLTFQGSAGGLYHAWVSAVDASGRESAVSNVTVFSCPVAQPVCTPDGSCSAPVPACGTTTTGMDNCGNACSKVGPACPVQVAVVCQPATQTVQVNQFASLVSNNTGRVISWSAPNGNPSSGSGTNFSTKFAQTGTFNVIVSDGLTSSTCQVVVQPVPAVPAAPNQNITLNCPDGTPITVSAGQNVNMNTLCQSQQQQQFQIAQGGQGGQSGPVTVTFGNVGVAAAPAQPVVIQPAVVQPVAAVQPVVIQPQVVQPQVAGVTVTALPKTGLPELAWSVLAFIPAGFGMRRFKKLHKDLEDDPTYIWEDRKFKAGL